MKRYTILAIENVSKHEVVVCEVGGHPNQIVRALKHRRRNFGYGYASARIVENDVPFVTQGDHAAHN
jgi:hypothetical protein